MKIEENQSQRQSARAVEAVAPLEERLRPYLFSPLHEVWIAAGQQEAPAAKACSLQDILAGGRTSAYLPVHKVHGAPVLDLTEAIQEETSQRKSDQAYDAKDEGLARWMETFPALRLAEPGSDQRIRFFSLLDPDHRASEAAFLPSCHPLVEEAKRDVLRDMERERAVSVQDKVAQRNRADAIGIFLQPRFADIRYLLHPSEMQVLGFLNIDFSGMPVKELLEPGGALQEIIFENPFDGFVLSSQRGEYRHFQLQSQGEAGHGSGG
jgi:hypothetical protein